MALPIRQSDRDQTTTRSPAVWEPFRELDELQRRTAELMESVWSGGTRPGDDLPWVPPVDVEETEDAWIVEAEVPGVRRQDVDVEVRDAELVVSGEIVERERTGILRRRTRRTGRFEYRIRLPEQPDPDGIDATLEDGVLTVRVPKSEQTRRRHVEVQAAQPS
jgi:HSP20 family protein